MRAVFAFCFVLESCEHQGERLERLCECLVQHKVLLATEGSVINNIPNILQCTLPPHPVYQTLLFECLDPRLIASHHVTVMWSCCQSCDCWVVLYHWIYKNECVHSHEDSTMHTVYAICSVQCCVNTASIIVLSWNVHKFPKLMNIHVTWCTNPPDKNSSTEQDRNQKVQAYCLAILTS